MSDMTNAVAIDLLDNLIGMVDDNQENDYDSALRMAIDALKAQADGDTISRQAAVDAIEEMQIPIMRSIFPEEQFVFKGMSEALSAIKDLSSAQPEKRTNERTETHACDCIERQAAICVIAKWMLEYGGEGEERERNALKKATEDIKELPSAQPEKRTNERTKTHACDCISRKDAIDAHYEYCNKHPDAGFPVWSLKILEDLPSAQPDLSGYSGRLWKAAYERGKAEAQQRWIPCSEWLPEEYGEYRITWVTSLVPSKRFIGDSEYEVTSVWDEERKGFKGEWLLDDYIKNYPDVKVIAWKPLEEPYREEGD